MADNSQAQSVLPRFDWQYNPPTLQQVQNLITDGISNGLAKAGSGGLSGAGSPEGVVTANPGTTYWDTTNQLLYVKDSGAGNTGWAIH